jgi:transcription termination factor NusA
VLISRTHPGLVKRLFELEVPEIYDGTVSIMGIKREAGSRTKMAVWSNDPEVDPIGACVGPKGGRVASIVNELGGEKIDIVRWSDDICKYAEQALSPAKLLSVSVDEDDDRKISVIVADDQLSLAIGRGGQNVRLATKLVGCSINISKREPTLSFEAQVAKAIEALVLAGISVDNAKILAQKGFTTLDGIAEEDPGELAEATGLDPDLAKEIVANARMALLENADGGNA